MCGQSQMGRFLLPVYALSLASVLSGFQASLNEAGAPPQWRARRRSWCSWPSRGVGRCIRPRFSSCGSRGLESQEAFLERTAPDYRTVEFINRTLSPETSGSSGGSVMVFFRHFCYVRVPFVDGTPEYSWLMDPARYNDADKLLAHLHEMNVRGIVKSPNDPKALAPAFSTLEQEGKLVPIASTDVENLTGTGRIYEQRQEIRVILLKVRE
jgi:hypothetical protein